MDHETQYRRIAARRARAARINGADAGFLHRDIGALIAERLVAVNRDFSQPGFLFNGPLANETVSVIGEQLTGKISDFTHLRHPSETDGVLDCEPEAYDLLISVFDLGQLPDLPIMLAQLLLALKSDGLFLGAFLCEGSFSEMRQALLRAEASLNAGVAARVAQFPALGEVGDLFQQTGFKLVVADVETRSINYSAVSRLVDDLRASACTYSSSAGQPVSVRVAKKFEGEFERQGPNGNKRFPVTLKIGLISGWKEHENQQKPLRPGSAAVSLADALKSET